MILDQEIYHLLWMRPLRSTDSQVVVVCAREFQVITVSEQGGGACDVVQRALLCTSGPFSTNDDVMDNMATGVDLACEPIVV